MPTFQGVSTRFVAALSPTVTITKPPGLAVGEGMVVHIAYLGTSVDIIPPAGWTEHFQSGVAYLATKIADAGDVAGANFIFTFAAGTGSECASLMHFSGIDPGGFVDNSALAAGVPVNPYITPALVASRTARFIISAAAGGFTNRGTGAIHTGPAGHTERADGVANRPSLAVYTKDVEVVSVGTEAILSANPDGGQHTITLAIVGPLPVTTPQGVDAIAVGAPGVSATFIPLLPPPPPPPVLVSGCEFAGIDAGSDPPTIRDACGEIPRVDDAVEFTGVQAGQAEPVEPVGGFFSLGRVRLRIFSPNSVQ